MQDNRLTPTSPKDTWISGGAYEAFVGRWSRKVAREFLGWLAVPAGQDWLDVGCGTGALCETILQVAAPRSLKGIDRSAEFIGHARSQIRDARVSFETGDAQALPEEANSCDVVVSSLMLNFVPRSDLAASEMARVAKPGGRVAAYVWDYAGQMQFLRHYWDAVTALDPESAGLDEGPRFPLCQPKPLEELFKQAGCKHVEVRAIDIPTVFTNFDDYWQPFLGGQGPAPSYCMSLSEEKRAALRHRIRAGLPFADDGSIPMIARAWAVRGLKA